MFAFFIPVFGLLGTLILFQAIEIKKLQKRVAALEAKTKRKVN